MSLLLSLALAAGTPAADPLDARTPVPPARHAPALRAPRADAPPIDWREANDTVLRRGGWRTYAREAAASEPGR